MLDVAPFATTTITISPDADVSVSSTTLEFTTGNWSVPQTVTVTAIDDAVVENGHTGTITHTASGGGYDGASIPNVVANVTDDDTGSVTITESATTTDVTEGGATDTYDVVLDFEPSATVTIAMASDPQATTSPATLTFTTGNWSTPQTVTVSAVDDAVVEEPHTGTISHTASGGSYDGVSISNVVANITDNDASVTITETGGSTDITEGGATDTYDVVLDSQPAATTTITITADSQATTSPATLTFTTSNWATPQTVTVTADDDAVVELNTHPSTITHSASGGGYDSATISNVVANITDNDASVTITETGGSTDITEGGATDTYDVVLDSQPAATTTITITADAQSTTTPATLAFTTVNWATPQSVTVTAADDTDVELNPHTSTIGHSASGGGYDSATIADVVANVTDDDVGNLTQNDYRWYDNVDAVQPTTAKAAENTAITEVDDTDVIRLRINISNGPNNLGAGATFKLQFSTATSTGWTDVGATSSSAIWRGFDNASVADGTTITTNLIGSSSPADKQTYEEQNDATANALAKNKNGEFDWVIQNNSAPTTTVYFFRIVRAIGTPLEGYTNYPQVTTFQPPAVTVTETGGSTDVTEGGATDTYDVVLDKQSSATVTITMGSGADATTTPSVLTFTTGNWDTPQTVTVTAVNDAIVEDGETETITHTPSGGGYDAVTIDDVVANVTDNDTASVTVTETSGSTAVTEGGATDTYDVVLDLEPSGTVTITIGSDSEANTSPTVLTFTTGNWFTAQTVTVTAVDDGGVELSPESSTITHSASGGSYDGVSISNVVANVTDDDASVTVTETGGSTDVAEGGPTDTYDVVLDKAPVSTVTITVSADSQATTSAATLTFTTGNWSSPQTITVTAIDRSGSGNLNRGISGIAA